MKKILCLLLASLTLLLAGCGISDQEVMDSIPTLVIQAKSDIKKLPTFGYDWTVTGQWGNGTSVIADTAHPQFAGYHFADGRFRLEIFEPTADGKARRIKDITITTPCAFYAIGDEGSFENHIHRITCLSPTGHSLHVYSDDARQGKVYEEEI